VLHPLARFDDRAGSVVAEHHRWVDDERADAAVRIVVHVGAADADRVQPDLHLARPNGRRQVDVTQRQLC
jgi:hypothetical protein